MAFYDSLDNHNNISISFSKNPRQDFGIFAKGYAEAARVLSNNFLKGLNRSDYNGYPILFLFRHSFELYLKNILYKAAYLASLQNQEFDNKLYNTHNLEQLAKVAKKVLSAGFPHNKNIEKLGEDILQIAHEFHDIDHISFSYRYPIDTKGSPSTKKNQIVNIEAIQVVFGKLFSELEMVDFGLTVETSFAMDIQRLFTEAQSMV
jgi:hypothetical protein